MTRRLAKTTDRGYGWSHQQERERHRPTVEAGEAWCAELICLYRSRWIPPTAPWDLAHDRRTGGYLGPAHRKCNRSEGIRWRNHRRRLRRTAASVPTSTSSKANRWKL